MEGRRRCHPAVVTGAGSAPGHPAPLHAAATADTGP